MITIFTSKNKNPCSPHPSLKFEETLWGQGRKDYTLSLLLLLLTLSTCLRVSSLYSSSSPVLRRAGRDSLGGDVVAPVWMPLHVSDASDGLHLWAAGSELIEMLELALL